MAGAPVARHAVAAVALLTLSPTASAHRLDEYLQATLVAIAPGRIELSIHLTPGIEIADKVLERIDWNRDGRISTSEAATYSELLRRALTLRLDAASLELTTVGALLPTPAELRTGEGIIELSFAASTAIAPGRHVLALENRHEPRIGVYLFNAALPASPAIEIAHQRRNDDQSSGEIEFTLAPGAAP